MKNQSIWDFKKIKKETILKLSTTFIYYAILSEDWGGFNVFFEEKYRPKQKKNK